MVIIQSIVWINTDSLLDWCSNTTLSQLLHLISCDHSVCTRCHNYVHFFTLDIIELTLLLSTLPL